jgi:hypothetical protein
VMERAKFCWDDEELGKMSGDWWGVSSLIKEWNTIAR